MCLECEKTNVVGATPFNGWPSFGSWAFISRLDDAATSSEWAEAARTVWARHNLNTRQTRKASTDARAALATMIRDDMDNERPLDGLAADIFDHEVARMDFDGLADALLGLHVAEYRPINPNIRIDQ